MILNLFYLYDNLQGFFVFLSNSFVQVFYWGG